MKKLFLSLIMLLPVINPALGMEEDGDHQAPCAEASLGVAALNAIADHLNAGNSHLVRSIAREWLEQHPNGTYREFLAGYTQRRSLPVNLIRAVWQEVMRMRIAQMAADLIVETSVTGNYLGMSYLGRVMLCCSRGFFETASGSNAPFSPTLKVEFSERITSYDGQELPSPLLVMNQLCDLDRDSWCCLVSTAHQNGFFIVLMFAGNYLIVACRGSIIIIPPISIPDIVSQFDDDFSKRYIVRPVVQQAIDDAIDQQPVFRTITEAVQYVEGLDS